MDTLLTSHHFSLEENRCFTKCRREKGQVHSLKSTVRTERTAGEFAVDTVIDLDLVYIFAPYRRVLFGVSRE